RDFTVADLFALEPERYFDAGDYLSYEVTVSMDGQTHTYLALALFHNRYGDDLEAGPEIWDSVSGMHGLVRAVWQEKRPAKSASRHRIGAAAPFRPAIPAVEQGHSRLRSDSAHLVAIDGSYDAHYETQHNVTGHTSGYHSGEAYYGARCFALDATHTRCEANSPGVFTHEEGSVSGLYTHGKGGAGDSTSGSGPRSQTVSCASGAVF